LVDQRPHDKDYGGQWEFPGGKIESGESAFDALVREWREEMGVIVREAEYLFAFTHTYQDRQVALDVWRVIRFEGRPDALEGQVLRWADTTTLKTLNFLEGNKQLLRRLSV
jgi:8-oxo-dGTP diphosphatase